MKRFKNCVCHSETIWWLLRYWLLIIGSGASEGDGIKGWKYFTFHEEKGAESRRWNHRLCKLGSKYRVQDEGKTKLIVKYQNSSPSECIGRRSTGSSRAPPRDNRRGSTDQELRVVEIIKAGHFRRWCKPKSFSKFFTRITSTDVSGALLWYDNEDVHCNCFSIGLCEYIRLLQIFRCCENTSPTTYGSTPHLFLCKTSQCG